MIRYEILSHVKVNYINKIKIILVGIVLFLSACSDMPVGEDEKINDAHRKILMLAMEESMDSDVRVVEVRNKGVFDIIFMLFFGFQISDDPDYERLPDMRSALDDLGAQGFHFFIHKMCNESPCDYTLSITLDKTFGPMEWVSWYVIYSTSHNLNEDIVPDVEAAISASNELLKHFCQPLEEENWFFCYNDH